MIETFKDNLKRKGINILEERNIVGIPELVVDKIPGQKISKQGWMRDKLYDFEPFFIKNHDSGKLSSPKLPIEELRQEVKVCKDFKDDEILLVDKIAILHLNKWEGEVFLVENKLDPFNEQIWKAKGFYDKAYDLYLKAKGKFPNIGDFELKNIGYDSSDRKLKFFDVFPKKDVSNNPAQK